ncbi:hypothetical protein NDU88_007067 [Pleurodeles waltl]|uniref:Uncharacterized protein n=1 Tax=Pleurodeles waltl TaxID=8319 RepID=A0AAV7LQZ4_PLEWA|nr:hypothetical protein NDU88_007067 [Pleurodeles waltl]
MDKGPEHWDSEAQDTNLQKHKHWVEMNTGVAPGTLKTRRKHWKADRNTSTGWRWTWGSGSWDKEDKTQTLESRQKHKHWVEMDTGAWLLGHAGQDANIGKQTETQALGGDGHGGVAPGTRRTRRKLWKADRNTSTGWRWTWGRGSWDKEDKTQTLESRQKHKHWVKMDTGRGSWDTEDKTQTLESRQKHKHWVEMDARRTRRKHWKADRNTSTGWRWTWGRGSWDKED